MFYCTMTFDLPDATDEKKVEFYDYLESIAFRRVPKVTMGWVCVVQDIYRQNEAVQRVVEVFIEAAVKFDQSIHLLLQVGNSKPFYHNISRSGRHRPHSVKM